MPDFSVPDWIKPPSPAEQERIDEAAAAASRKAYGMIRRGIGVNRMQADAQEAIKSGADPVTARQTALLNNAHLIFGDNPEEIANIVNSQQANQIRDRALLQSQAKLAVETQHYSNLAENAKAKLDETTKYHADTLTQKRESAAAKEKSILYPSIVQVPDPATGKNVSVFRRGPNSFEIVKPAASKLTVVNNAEIKDIYKRIENLQLSHDAITPEEGAVTSHPNTIKRMRLSAEIQKLREKAQTIEAKALGKNAEPMEPAAPDQSQNIPNKLKEGTIIKQGGKRFKYNGGDPKDPDSYSEIVE